MPTYDYECARCKKQFELFQKMTDEPIGLCPSCGGKAHRLIGAGTGIIFKGSGFYETDYKKKKGSEEKKACPDAKSDSCKGCSLKPK